jgi:hypothetical protein
MRKEKGRDEGATFMETLICIAIVLVVSGSVITAFASGMRALWKAADVSREAYSALEIDRSIRLQAGEFSIPYWEEAESKAAFFRDSLWRSRFGGYIRSIDMMRDREGLVRGLRVEFRLNEKDYRTEALFASAPLVGRK